MFTNDVDSAGRAEEAGLFVAEMELVAFQKEFFVDHDTI
jgi:hypothetical protein